MHLHQALDADHFVDLDLVEGIALDTDQREVLGADVHQRHVAGIHAGRGVRLTHPGIHDGDHVTFALLWFRCAGCRVQRTLRGPQDPVGLLVEVVDQRQRLLLVQAHVGHGEPVVLLVHCHCNGILPVQHLVRGAQPLQQPRQLAPMGHGQQVRAQRAVRFLAGDGMAGGAAGAEDLLATRKIAQLGRV